MRRRFIGWSLTTRAVVATGVVALVAVAITAAIALPLVVRSADDQARLTLAEKARVAANVIEGRDTPAAASRAEQRARNVAQTLREQGVDTVLITNGKPDQGSLPARLVRQIADGSPISTRIVYNGRLTIVEGRPAGDGDGIVLLQASSTVNAVTVLGRIWIALAAGLLAALAAGFLLARRLGRPLRQLASAARRISAGDRRVRAPTDEPAEVAAVSVALNDLVAALATSEHRQRAFLMSVSHELRTPLTTIRGYAEALADGVVATDGAQRAGQTMLAESEHLDRLIEDLLVLARLEADDFPLEVLSIDLVALISAAAESWGGRCAAVGVVLRTELPDIPVYVRTDPGRLRQVVDGLLENALRVVPPGAPVVLAVRPPGATPEDTTLALPVVGRSPVAPGQRDQPYAVLEVRDGGPGFTDDDLAVVFERGALYERYKGIRKVGSGMGLALAARLITRLGGRIQAGHAPEGGARFTVRVPL